jgi:hypothetical protein
MEVQLTGASSRRLDNGMDMLVIGPGWEFEQIRHAAFLTACSFESSVADNADGKIFDPRSLKSGLQERALVITNFHCDQSAKTIGMVRPESLPRQFCERATFSCAAGDEESSRPTSSSVRTSPSRQVFKWDPCLASARAELTGTSTLGSGLIRSTALCILATHEPGCKFLSQELTGAQLSSSTGVSVHELKNTSADVKEDSAG